MALAPVVVAADGGANACVDAGVSPVAVIGDMDSIADATRAALSAARVIEVTEQESTDFDKAVTRIRAPFVVAVGFTGARLDHTLAVLSSLTKGVGPTTFVLGRGDVIFAAPRLLELDVTAGTRLSLYPLGPVTGRSEGLAWPIDGLTLGPLDRLGTSNRVTGPVTLEMDAPGCLVLMPRDVLASVVRALVPGAVP
jgi:thiamine pyrophosphokinase